MPGCAASTKAASDDEGASGAGHSHLLGDVLGVAGAEAGGAQGSGVVEHSQPVVVLQEGGDKHLRDAGRRGNRANGPPHPYLLEYPLRHCAARPFESAATPAGAFVWPAPAAAFLAGPAPAAVLQRNGGAALFRSGGAAGPTSGVGLTSDAGAGAFPQCPQPHKNSFPIWKMPTARIQATANCTPTAAVAFFAPMSFACSATVARHGVYAKTKTRKAKAASP